MRFPAPFFRPGRQLWYVQLDGKQINLGGDKAAAFQQYYELMRRRGAGQPIAPAAAAESPALVNLFRRFHAWLAANRSRRTAETYLERIQSFIDWMPDHAMTVAALRPFHVSEWADSHKDWTPYTKRGRIAAVQAAIAWAVRQGIITASPIVDMQKPSSGRRENHIDAEQFRKLLMVTQSKHFRDLLEVAWETGARPQELFRVDADHLHAESSRWIFREKESKGGKVKRVVFLTPRALAICLDRTVRQGAGPIFRNMDGLRWNKSSAGCQMRMIHARGAKRIALVDLRHSFATRLLASGVNPITLAALMGHRDGAMLAKVYSHVHQDAEHLFKALGQGTTDAA